MARVPFRAAARRRRRRVRFAITLRLDAIKKTAKIKTKTELRLKFIGNAETDSGRPPAGAGGSRPAGGQAARGLLGDASAVALFFCILVFCYRIELRTLRRTGRSSGWALFERVRGHVHCGGRLRCGFIRVG